MLSVQAEGEAEKVGLTGVGGEVVVGEIADRVCFKVQDGKGLFFAGRVRAKSAVEENGEAAIG